MKPVPLLVPDLPATANLVPLLQEIEAGHRYTNFGPLNQRFELALAESVPAICGSPVHGVTASSGTAALTISLMVLGIGSGSRVLVPSIGFAAVPAAVASLGATPVFAPVSNATWELTPEYAWAIAAKERCNAVVPISPFGYPLPTNEWVDFSRQSSIPVVIDAAAGLTNQSVGPGVMAIFSLHATKAFGIGEGGVVATTDRELASRIRRASCFGFHEGCAIGPGTNAKLSEFHAAIGLAQWQRREWITSHRQKLRDTYLAKLATVAHLLHPQCASVAVPSYMPIRLASPEQAVELMGKLGREAVEARRWAFPALPEHPAFASFPVAALAVEHMPAYSDLAGSIICLPFHHYLEDTDISRVCQLVKGVLS